MKKTKKGRCGHIETTTCGLPHIDGSLSLSFLFLFLFLFFRSLILFSCVSFFQSTTTHMAGSLTGPHRHAMAYVASASGITVRLLLRETRRGCVCNDLLACLAAGSGSRFFSRTAVEFLFRALKAIDLLDTLCSPLTFTLIHLHTHTLPYKHKMPTLRTCTGFHKD